MKPKENIFFTLKSLNIKFKTEYKFLPDRKFRFDFAIPDKKIAIEYEGLFSNKSRHTTVIGYSNDAEKYNAATIRGWRVLRYTAINYWKLSEDIEALLKSKKLNKI